MPVHPSPGHDRDSVLNAAAWYFQNTPDFVFRPLYRLDRDTTGALVLAKNKFAANAKLTKTYRAVCEGETPESGCVNAVSYTHLCAGLAAEVLGLKPLASFLNGCAAALRLLIAAVCSCLLYTSRCV